LIYGETALKESTSKEGGANKMKGLMKKMETMFVAATFAEAGEFETAKNILRENTRPQQEDRIDRPSKEVRAPGIRR
jgi:hypothetical protein